MKIFHFLKRFSYHPFIRSMIRIFGFSPIIRKWYCRSVWPKDNILDLECGGIKMKFYVRTNDDLRTLEFDVFKEQRIIKCIISFLNPGDIFYDVGAYVGLYTIPLAKIVGNRGWVIAFEPSKQSYERLQENLNLNALNNVRLFCLALGNKNGVSKLFIGNIPISSSLVYSSAFKQNYQIVKVFKGDDLKEKENLPSPRAVKIDVEGYEYEVIQGLHRTLLSPSCELVCCEIHPQFLPEKIKPEMVLNLLKSMGFNHIKIFKSFARTEYHALCYKTK